MADRRPQTPLAPRPKIEVTQELIDTSVQKDSSHCMIAEAIRMAVPDARHISVDLQTVRWSDPARRLRYTYLTPRVAQLALIDFDQGRAPEPFSFAVRQGHVTRAYNNSDPVQAKYNAKKRAKRVAVAADRKAAADPAQPKAADPAQPKAADPLRRKRFAAHE